MYAQAKVNHRVAALDAASVTPTSRRSVGIVDSTSVPRDHVVAAVNQSTARCASALTLRPGWGFGSCHSPKR